MSLFNHKSSNFNTAVGFKDDDEAKNILLAIVNVLHTMPEVTRSEIVEVIAKHFGYENDPEIIKIIATVMKFTEGLVSVKREMGERMSEEEDDDSSSSDESSDYFPS